MPKRALHPETRHTLRRTDWEPLEAAHRRRVEPWILPRLERRRDGRKHPVDDFLFEYYTYRPAQLSRWHPGPGARLEAPAEHLRNVRAYVVEDGTVGVDRAAVGRQVGLLDGIERLLEATAGRPARIGCAALHEWAMVYGLPQSEVRHRDWPLRLSPQQILEVADQVGLRCTHFDAFRFFTPQAAPRNRTALTRQTQIDMEQPGCLHAVMDLYKWAYRLSPLIGSDLIADAFELARQARTLDMRAAPYDLAALGLTPLELETPAGRAAFAELQRDMAGQGQTLRRRLIEAIGVARTWWTQGAEG